MNTFAYDKKLPCLNPSCKSHGRPHPNCRCYGFSDGGEVGSYCSEARAHKEDCEYYFSDGGLVPNYDELEPSPTETPNYDDLPEGGVEVQTPNYDDLDPNSVAPSESGKMEQLKAGAEGLAQGLLGDLAKVAQVKTGISTLEDIERREREFPVTHGVAKAGAFAGSLYAGPMKWVAAKAGSKLLGNVIASSTYALSDNTAKAFLGQPGGDVESVVAGTILQGGLEGMMNTLTAGLFSAVPKAAKAAFNEKTIRAAEDAMISLAEKPVSKAISVSGAATAAKMFGSTGIVGDLAEFQVVRQASKKWMDKIIGKPLTKANQYVGDAILNTLSKTDFLGVPSIMRWAERANGGLNAVTAPVEALFKSGIHFVVDETKPEVEDQIKAWMDEGGIDGEIQKGSEPEGFAEGGQVGGRRSFERLYPAENMMLNEARTRVSGYLNTLRPSKNPSKLPFDSALSQKQQEKQYNKAIRFAANPMSIMGLVNNGKLTAEDVKHFRTMWPEAHSLLSKKITERIIQAQLKGEKPPYSKRKSMSLFLGSDLDFSTTPQSIGIIQGMYAAKNAQKTQAAKGSKKALAKSSNQYQTDEQAREKRMQNQK